jgi:hypothetical protein
MFQIYKLKNLNHMKIIISWTKKCNICQVNFSKTYISKSNVFNFKAYAGVLFNFCTGHGTLL